MPKSVKPRTVWTRGVEISEVTIGYVTWSSMRSGLRPSHSVTMITCTSEMSGTASSGVRCMAHAPHTARASAPHRTTTRLAAHHAIQRSIIGNPLRLPAGRACPAPTRSRYRAVMPRRFAPSRCPPRVTVTVTSQRPAMLTFACPRYSPLPPPSSTASERIAGMFIDGIGAM